MKPNQEQTKLIEQTNMDIQTFKKLTKDEKVAYFVKADVRTAEYVKMNDDDGTMHLAYTAMLGDIAVAPDGQTDFETESEAYHAAEQFQSQMAAKLHVAALTDEQHLNLENAIGEALENQLGTTIKELDISKVIAGCGTYEIRLILSGPVVELLIK